MHENVQRGGELAEMSVGFGFVLAEVDRWTKRAESVLFCPPLRAYLY